MLAPMLAESTDFKQLDAFIDDPNWVFEQKADGNRILFQATAPGDRGVATTRSGSLYTKKIPASMKDFRFPRSMVLDGELVSDEFWLFDLPFDIEHNSVGVRPNLAQRRLWLEQVVKETPFRIVPQAADAAQKRLMRDLSVTHGWEGLMVKDALSAYHGGRSRSWLKAKQVQTADVIVIAVGEDGREAATLAAIDPHAKKAVEVGRTSLIGKPKVKPGDVVEVRYLYLGANKRLYQPTLLRVRTDKRPLECLTTQFRMVNKAMLASL